ncbi:MAG: hypothetical protein AB1758_09470 [Candidatus Eremiobacterota bacterium]
MTHADLPNGSNYRIFVGDRAAARGWLPLDRVLVLTDRDDGLWLSPRLRPHAEYLGCRVLRTGEALLHLIDLALAHTD